MSLSIHYVHASTLHMYNIMVNLLLLTCLCLIYIFCTFERCTFSYCHVCIFRAIIGGYILVVMVWLYCMSCVGGVRMDSGAELAAVRQAVVGVASANGVAAIDTVSTNFSG